MKIDMTTTSVEPDQNNSTPPSALHSTTRGTAFGCPRDFLANRFVYVVMSPRAGGLSVGVNFNPDKFCNFDCVYCEVNRSIPAREQRLDVPVMSLELERTIDLVESGRIRELPNYSLLPEDVLRVRHVALSGDGEPTLCPNFVDAIQGVVHVRARAHFPFFKVVLITNATGLDRPEVDDGLNLLTSLDEIWVKLDAGTQAHMAAVNVTQEPLQKVLDNILALARRRSVVVQSLFPAVASKGPSEDEIDQYVERLCELTAAGAKISLIQLYSATRPTPHSEVGHLPLKTLSRIAQKVRGTTGLRVEVF